MRFVIIRACKCLDKPNEETPMGKGPQNWELIEHASFQKKQDSANMLTEFTKLKSQLCWFESQLEAESVENLQETKFLFNTKLVHATLEDQLW